MSRKLKANKFGVSLTDKRLIIESVYYKQSDIKRAKHKANRSETIKI